MGKDKVAIGESVDDSFFAGADAGVAVGEAVDSSYFDEKEEVPIGAAVDDSFFEEKPSPAQDQAFRTKAGRDEDAAFPPPPTQAEVVANRYAEHPLLSIPIVGDAVWGLGRTGASLMGTAERVVGGDTYAEAGQMMDEARAEMDPSFAGRVAESVAGSLPYAGIGAGVSLATGNPLAGAAAVAGVSGAAQTSDAYKESGDLPYAIRSGLIEGGTTAAFSLIGAGGWEKAITQGLEKGLVPFGVQALSELSEEESIYLAQLLNEKYSGRDLSGLTPEKIAEDAAVVAASVGTMMGTTHAAGATARAAGNAIEERQWNRVVSDPAVQDVLRQRVSDEPQTVTVAGVDPVPLTEEEILADEQAAAGAPVAPEEISGTDSPETANAPQAIVEPQPPSEAERAALRGRNLSDEEIDASDPAEIAAMLDEAEPDLEDDPAFQEAFADEPTDFLEEDDAYTVDDARREADELGIFDVEEEPATEIGEEVTASVEEEPVEGTDGGQGREALLGPEFMGAVEEEEPAAPIPAANETYGPDVDEEPAVGPGYRPALLDKISEQMAALDSGEEFELDPDTTGLFEPKRPDQYTGLPDDWPLVEIPLDKLKLSKDVPNFKEGADERGVVEPLKGKFQRNPTRPIVAWERLNGDIEVITGRHRTALARESGEKSIPANVVREADGFTKEQAMVLDAESNIQDGTGTANDYATYFKEAGLSRDDAEARGLLSNAKGKAGWNLGVDATDEVRESFRGGAVTEAQAIAIGRGAPGDQMAQRVGLRQIAKDKRATMQEVENAVRVAQVLGSGYDTGQEQQFDLFGGMDDSGFQEEIARRAAIASEKQREIGSQLRVLQAAKIDPAKAKAEGIEINVSDRGAVKARQDALTRDKIRWQDWSQFPDLVDQVMKTEASRPQQQKLPGGGRQEASAPTDKLFRRPDPTARMEFDWDGRADVARNRIKKAWGDMFTLGITPEISTRAQATLIKEGGVLAIYYTRKGVRNLGAVMNSIRKELETQLGRPMKNREWGPMKKAIKSKTGALRSQISKARAADTPKSRVNKQLVDNSRETVTMREKDVLEMRMKEQARGARAGFKEGRVAERDSQAKAEHDKAVRRDTPKRRIEEQIVRGPEETVVSTTRKLLKYALTYEARGARAGFRAGRLDMAATHEEVLEFAKGLLPAKQYKLVAKIADKVVKSTQGREAAMRNIVKAVNKLVEKHEHASAIGELKQTIADAKKDKLRPEFRAKVDALLEAFAMAKPSRETLDRMNSVLDAATRDDIGEIPQRLIERAKRILADAKKPTLEKMTTDDIKELKNTILHLIHLNQTKQGLIFLRRGREFAATVKQAAVDVMGRQGVDPKLLEGPEGMHRRHAISSLEKMARFAQKSMQNIILDIAGEKSPAWDMLINALSDGVTHFSRLQFRAQDHVNDTLKRLGLSYADVSEMSDIVSGYTDALDFSRKRGLVKEPTVHTVKLADGRKMQMTSAERISFLLAWGDSSTRAEIIKDAGDGIVFARDQAKRRWKMNAEDARIVLASATKNEKAIAKAMSDYVNGPLRTDLSQWWVDRYGFDIFDRKDYWPRRRQTDPEPDELKMVKGGLLEHQAIFKERSGSTAPIIIGDAFGEYYAHTNRTSALMAKANATRDAMMMLDSDNDFTKAVRLSRRDGDATIQELKKRVEQFGTLQVRKSNAFDHLVRSLIQSSTVANLALNVPVIASQWISVFSANADIDMKYIVRGLGEVPRRGFKLDEIEIFKWAPQLRTVIQGGGHQVVTPETTGQTVQGFYGRVPFRDKAMGAINKSNEIAVAAIWNAAKMEGKDKGMKGEALLRYAGERATQVYNRSQPNFDVTAVAGAKLDAKDSVAYAAATMYTGQTQIILQQMIRAMTQYKHGDIGLAKAVRDVVAPSLVQGAIFYGIKQVYDMAGDALGDALGLGDDEDDKDAKERWAGYAADVVGGTIGTMLVAGPILDTITRLVKKTLMDEKFSPWDAISNVNPIADIGIDTFDTLVAVLRAVDASFDPDMTAAEVKKEEKTGKTVEPAEAARAPKEWFNATDQALDTLGVYAGLPIRHIKDTLVWPVLEAMWFPPEEKKEKEAKGISLGSKPTRRQLGISLPTKASLLRGSSK